MKRPISALLVITMFFQSLVAVANPLPPRGEPRQDRETARPVQEAERPRPFTPELHFGAPEIEGALVPLVPAQPVQAEPAQRIENAPKPEALTPEEQKIIKKRSFFRNLASGQVGDHIRRVLATLRVRGEEIPKFEIERSPIPSVIEQPDGTLRISAGLLGAVDNEDELAAVLARHLALNNEEDTKRVLQDPKIRQMMEGARAFEKLNEEARYYLLTDMSVVDRLIRAGYSPWAYLSILRKIEVRHRKPTWDRKMFQWVARKFNRAQFAEMDKAPSLEIRTSVIKSYVHHLQGIKDFVDQLPRRTEIPRELSKPYRLLKAYATLAHDSRVQAGAAVAATTFVAMNGFVPIYNGASAIINTTASVTWTVAKGIWWPFGKAIGYGVDGVSWAAGVAGTAISTAAQWSWSVIKPPLSLAGSALSAAADAVGTVASVAWDWTWWGISSVGAAVGSVIASAASYAWDTVTSGFLWGVDLAASAIGGVWWLAKTGALGFWSGVTTVWDFLFPYAAGALGWVYDKGAAILSSIDDFFGKFLSAIGGAIASGFWAIADALSWIWNNLIPVDFIVRITTEGLSLLSHLIPSFDTIATGLTWGGLGLAVSAFVGTIAYFTNRFIVHPKDARKLLEEILKRQTSLPEDLSERVNADLLSFSWKQIVGLLEKTQTAMDQFPMMHTFRGWSGLADARKSSLNFLSDLIEVTVREMNQDLNERKQLALWLSVMGLADRLPGFVIEHPEMQARLEQLREVAAKMEMRSPLTEWERKTFAQIPGEHAFETRLRLLSIAQTAPPEAPGEAVDFLSALYKRGLTYTSFTLFADRARELARFVASGANRDPDRVGRLRELESAYGLRSTMQDPTLLSRWRRRVGSFVRAYSTFENSLSWRLKSISDTAGSTMEDSWFNRYDRWRFRLILQKNVRTMQDLITFIQDEMDPLNLNMSMFTSEFERIIQSRPDMINSYNDVQALLQLDYFWVKSMDWHKPRPGSLDRIFTKTLQRLIEQFPNIWSYEPASTARYHRMIILRMQEIGIFPTQIESQIELWMALTNRGVSGDSDRFFYSIYEKANEEQKAFLERVGLQEGRVWEQEIKALIAENKVWTSNDFRRLKETNDPQERSVYLQNLISLIQSYMPEGGWPYMELLEKLSVAILSTEDESAVLQKAKSTVLSQTPSSATENSEPSKAGNNDLGDTRNVSLGTLGEILDEVLNWRRSDQWDFLLFLRGDAPPSQRVRLAFQMLGPDRVKRMWDVLPVGTRTALLDTFLSSPKGLVPSIGKGHYTQVVIEHLIAGATEAAENVARHLLEGFLHAMVAVGNEELQSSILAYLLAIPPNEQRSVAHVLKEILEVFGPTGVKLGQQLAASQLLSEEYSRVLDELQDRARVPERESIWQDLRSILQVPRVPFRVGPLLGAASIKYALAAQAEDVQQDEVLKIFRLEALAHTRLEFKILDAMVYYLIGKYGARYAVLKGIVKASITAVSRELIAEDEVARSHVFRQDIYNYQTEENIRFTAPVETFVNERLIRSQLMDGVSFKDLPEELKPMAAAVILREHSRQMWGAGIISRTTGGRVLMFDPDRHGANFKFRLLDEATREIGAIDPGQLHQEIPIEWRDRLVTLFAVAQFMAPSGALEWGGNIIASTLGLTAEQTAKLKVALTTYFPKPNMREITAYYSVLGALDDAGVSVPIFYYDFVKAIIIFNRYTRYVPEGVESPAQMLESKVTAEGERLFPAQPGDTRSLADRAEDQLRSLMTASEKAHYGVDQASGRLDQWRRRVIPDLKLSRTRRRFMIPQTEVPFGSASQRLDYSVLDDPDKSVSTDDACKASLTTGEGLARAAGE